MGGGVQIVHTVCMDTRDADRNGEGEFAIRLGGDNPRFSAVKVALGSLEFPMVQWSIERDWNRLYFSEGYRLSASSSFLRLHESLDGDDGTEILVHLPLHVNNVRSVTAHARGSRVSCEHPHGLWVDGRRSMLDAIEWGDVELMCTNAGRVSLSSLYSRGELHYLSETDFVVGDRALDCARGGGGILYTPPYPSPASLCGVLSYALAYSDTSTTYEVVYDASENRASLQAGIFPAEANAFTIRLYGSELAVLLGYPSAMHERRFRRRGVADNVATIPADPYGLSERPYSFYNPEDDRPPFALPSQKFAGWMCVEVEPGWYSPSHRPMCTGQPLRLTTELEDALNTLYFPVPERIPNGMATAHFLMFVDPGGSTHNCAVYAGKYTADGLCAHLENEMSRLSSVPGTAFTIEYNEDEQRFTFMCEVKQNGIVSAASFALLFNHPAQFNPARLGFSPVALFGSDTYTSTHPVHIPSSQGPMRSPSNMYKVTEIVHQKRLRLAPTPPVGLTGTIVDYDVDDDVLCLRTHAGQLPYAHGLQPGDVVQLSASESSNELYRYVEGSWRAETCDRCPIASSWGRSGVVVNSGLVQCGDGAPGAELLELRLRVRPARDLVNHIGQILSVQPCANPFNLCFGLPRSIGCQHLGFPRGATQWGIDGATPSGRLHIPPFEAPGVHSLDHPDYVLMYLGDGKRSTALQHQYGRNATTPFAKLVLYPMFREERMLPRETTLLSGESLTYCHFWFENPDGTKYHFHNHNFSFSLNFVKVQD